MYKLGMDLGTRQNNKLIKKKYATYNPLPKAREIDPFVDNKYIDIGCSGGCDSNNYIFYGHKTLIVGKINFKQVLAKYKVPVHIDNDCNCAAITTAKKQILMNF